MSATPKPKLTHMAIFTHDLEKMVDFYTRVMGLTISDRGKASALPTELVFMSSDAAEHHQFVLASGRPEEAKFSIAQQISFLVDSLEEVRAMRDRLISEGVKIKRAVTHGNAWSIYFEDPEGNTLEIYAHTPWHVPQPHGRPLDFSMSNEQIIAMTEAHCRETPGFMPAAERQKVLAKRIEAAKEMAE